MVYFCTVQKTFTVGLRVAFIMVAQGLLSTAVAESDEYYRESRGGQSESGDKVREPAHKPNPGGASAADAGRWFFEELARSGISLPHTTAIPEARVVRPVEAPTVAELSTVKPGRD